MLKAISEIREAGWQALVDRLGIAGATLFVLEHEKGYGDYTKERRVIFEKKSLDEIVKEVKDKNIL